MRIRPLGNTGLCVSEVALGTVELGMDYGFRGSEGFQRPERSDAVRLVRRAVDRGINLIDTAPAYGQAEEIVGEALAGMADRPYVATKITISERGAPGERRQALMQSIESSLRALRVETLDLVQIHNATPPVLADEDSLAALERAKDRGKIRFLGASIYGEEAALLALQRPSMMTVQAPFNLLDRQMEGRVFPAAAERGAGILVRSAFLRGVLTAQVRSLPPALDPLRQAAVRAMETAGIPPERLAALALRFCISTPQVASVIIGVRSEEELEVNLAAVEEGPLDGAALDRLRGCALDGEPLLNPTNWKGLI